MGQIWPMKPYHPAYSGAGGYRISLAYHISTLALRTACDMWSQSGVCDLCAVQDWSRVCTEHGSRAGPGQVLHVVPMPDQPCIPNEGCRAGLWV